MQVLVSAFDKEKLIHELIVDAIFFPNFVSIDVEMSKLKIPSVRELELQTGDHRLSPLHCFCLFSSHGRLRNVESPCPNVIILTTTRTHNFDTSTLHFPPILCKHYSVQRNFQHTKLHHIIEICYTKYLHSLRYQLCLNSRYCNELRI